MARSYTRYLTPSAPGELLCADTFFVGTLKGVGKVYLHAVVDTDGSYAFGFLHVSKKPEAAVAVLHNEVLPFFRSSVPSDNPIGWAGRPGHLLPTPSLNSSMFQL
jgi:hypothetical protein